MLGTQAVVVKECSTADGACPSGASVDGYRLLGYFPGANVAGSFTLTGALAGAAGLGTGNATLRW
jgi:hypothetical protein